MNWQRQVRQLLEEAEVRLSEVSTEPLTAKAQAEIQGLRVLMARALGILSRNIKYDSTKG